MAFEFEALVGHLYVVDGRAISTLPPGALVEVSPRKAARGREADTFFALVLPTGETTAPAAFYEQMAALAADQYFSSTGSVTTGLRAIFHHLNENLFEHNSRESKRYEASLVCAVLKGADLYVARAGAAVALFRHQGQTQPFPTDFDNDEALYGVPLGVRPVPDVRMGMYTVEMGTRIVLAEAALADSPWDSLLASMAAEDLGTALVGMKTLGVQQLTLLAAEFVPPEVPTPQPVREGENNRAAASAPVPEIVTPVMVAEADGASGLRLSEARGEGLKRAVGTAALSAANVLDSANEVIEEKEPREDRRSLLSTRGAAAIAILIPIVVVVAVVVFWVGGTGQSEFDRCVLDASGAGQLARSIANTDVQGTLAAWQAVLLVTDQCEQMRANDPIVAALREEARGVRDALLRVDRRPTNTVVSLPSANLTRAVLQAEDLYVLDDTNDQVYRLTLDTEGTGIIDGGRDVVNGMRRNVQVNQFQVGDLFDIAWAEDGSGLSQGNSIVAIDRNGILIDCPPRFIENCNAQQLDTTIWTNPVAIQFWQGRMYMLDPAANQIWRYNAAGGAYPNPPIEYFGGQGRPNLTAAVDFAIDTGGSIYVTFSDGSLLKYTGGENIPFQFANFPTGQAMTSVTNTFFNANPTDLRMYFVSRNLQTIYQTTHAGTFEASYRAENEADFETLNDVAVDPTKNLIYALSGNSVFALPRAR